MVQVVVNLRSVRALVYTDGKPPIEAHSDDWAETYAEWLRYDGHAVAVIHLQVDAYCQTCGAIEGITRPHVPSRCTNKSCPNRRLVANSAHGEVV